MKKGLRPEWVDRVLELVVGVPSLFSFLSVFFLFLLPSNLQLLSSRTKSKYCAHIRWQYDTMLLFFLPLKSYIIVSAVNCVKLIFFKSSCELSNKFTNWVKGRVPECESVNFLEILGSSTMSFA